MLRMTKTENGLVRGLPGTDARITVYKGIPFADDTSGANRWRPPQPAKNWEGVRDCYDFGPIAMQPIPGINPDAFYSKEWHVDPKVPMSENCLNVNIWTPAKTGDEKLPVFLWIHGGGLIEGYSYEMEFDGERIASRGVVVASISYRLNAFGFLAHPELTAADPEHPTSFGYLDQKAGIEWVKRNIAYFGGDPDNITLGGQSAGGISVFKHIYAPGEKGLVKRAIIQSSCGGSMKPPYPVSIPGDFNLPMDYCEQFGKDFLENTLGVKTIEEARAIPAEVIRDKVAEKHIMFFSAVDGPYVSKNVGEAVYDGDIFDVDLLFGYTRDEAPVYAQGETLEEIRAWAAKTCGPIGDRLVDLWREMAGSDDPEAVKKVSHSNFNETSTYAMADEFVKQGRTVYTYEFDPELPGDDAGSFHSSDLWFSFETLMRCWRPFDGHHYDLARKMCNYWTNFMKTGNPNGNDADGTPMPQWDAYTAEKPTFIQFFDEISIRTDRLNPAKQLLVDVTAEHYKK